jgi:hypothetical protein
MDKSVFFYSVSTFSFSITSCSFIKMHEQAANLLYRTVFGYSGILNIHPFFLVEFCLLFWSIDVLVELICIFLKRRVQIPQNFVPQTCLDFLNFQ